jgi:uncharacterized protein involved in exopolysaccharide biosynthesis
MTPTDRETTALYVAILRKHKLLLVALPLTLAAIAGTGSLLRPRMYAARAAFLASEPQSMSGSLGALSSVASQLGVPALSAIASGSASLSPQFYADLLTSNSVLHALVTERFEANKVEVNGGKPFTGTLVEYLHPKGKTPTDNELSAMRSVVGRILTVSVDRVTGIVRFEVLTTNRQLSAIVARRLLEFVNDFNLRRRQTQASAEREFDARRARAALDSLHIAEANLAEFRTSNIDFSRSPRLATHEAELQRRIAIAQQIYAAIAQRYELANIEAVRNTPVITVFDAPEGLVEARPRNTVAITIGVFVFGVLLAAAIALVRERRYGARYAEPAP